MKERKKFFALLLVLLTAGFTAGLEAKATDTIVGRTNTLLSAAGAGSAEAPLGLAAAQALCFVAETDVAIVNAGDLGRDIPAGDVTEERLKSAFSEDRMIAVALVTPVQLKMILENGLSHICLDLENGDRIDHDASDWGAFPQTAGLSYKYDASAPVGERVLSMELGGQELSLTDDTTKITLAASTYLLSGGWGSTVIDKAATLDCTLSEAFAQLLATASTGLDVPDSQMRVIGSGDNALVEQLLPGRAAGIALLIFVLCFGVIRCGIKAKEDADF